MAAIAPELLAQLRDAMGRGDDASALRLADAVLANDPGHPPTRAWLSARARQLGALDEACGHATHGLALHPGSAMLRFQLGAAQAAAGDLDGATTTLQAVSPDEPAHTFARLWLGGVQMQRGAHDAGLRTYAQALATAERLGLLQARLPADVRVQVEAAIALLRAARTDVIERALAPFVLPPAEAARIRDAFAPHLGEPTPTPAHALQQPSFLFVPGLADRPWWPREAFPFLANIEAHTDAIRDEMLAVLADDASGFTPYLDMPDDAPAAPMWGTLNRSRAWTGYHFFRHGERIEPHCRRCPRTAAALDALPLLRIPGHAPEALFSVLRPGTHIPPHTGVINGRLTVHLPLVVPPDCGALAVAREARPWHEGECLVFDDSFVHEAINRSVQTRVVLIFDLWHPGLPEATRAALAATIAAYGAFNRRCGLGDPMEEVQA
jgi:aspartate beta-hydroxylase